MGPQYSPVALFQSRVEGLVTPPNDGTPIPVAKRKGFQNAPTDVLLTETGLHSHAHSLYAMIHQTYFLV